MFAFALWDENNKSLLLARDRVGIKPLYYARTANSIVFGSEIKALLADPDLSCEIDFQSIDKFLTHFCLPGAETLWKNIYKLEPGSYLLVRGDKIVHDHYWNLQFLPAKYSSFSEAADELYRLTEATVNDHMISDVPVGFLLSGGVDSTVVLSCAAAKASGRLHTFTVGFGDAAFEDERPYAKLAATRFDTDHNEITITPSEFWEFLPTLVMRMEEPVCDPPAVSLHYVSRLARDHVKVLLSGEGGDEAFGGYNDYRNILIMERVKRTVPALKTHLANMLKIADSCSWLRKITKFAPFFTTEPQDYYYSRVAGPFSYFNRNKDSIYTPEFRRMVRPASSVEIIRRFFGDVSNQPLLNQLQYIDTKTSLPDDLLIKADRMTMGNSLELRVPLLDHKMLEFAASLPPDYRVKGLATKRILKKAFAGRIPAEILRRKKAGFPIPIERWTQRELRDQVRDVLLSKKALDRGYFTRRGIEELLSLGSAGQPVAKEIFSLLTLELLHTQFVDNLSSVTRAFDSEQPNAICLNIG